MGDSIPTCIENLSQSDAVRQADAAETLASLGEAARPAIVALVQTCGSDDEDVSNWCASALEGVGPPTVEQIDDLKLLARASDENVAFWAVTLLGRAGAASAVPVLVERLADSATPSVQRRAAWALGRLGHGANSALDSLRQATASADRPLASQAQEAITKIEAS
ncbi:MAG: HEAT repeat domain-containing protein [Planctomycetes bacterium]|nr:HEAT repeat domain-containing protein [Planctomycetota bacterium]